MHAKKFEHLKIMVDGGWVKPDTIMQYIERARINETPCLAATP